MYVLTRSGAGSGSKYCQTLNGMHMQESNIGPSSLTCLRSDALPTKTSRRQLCDILSYLIKLIYFLDLNPVISQIMSQKSLITIVNLMTIYWHDR